MPTSGTSNRTSGTWPRTARTATRIRRTSTKTRETCTRIARTCATISAGTNHIRSNERKGPRVAIARPFLIGKSGFASDANRSFKHFYGGTAHAGDELSTRLRDFDFDVAGAGHFRALQNTERLAGGELAVADEIGAEGARGGARCGVFVNLPREHAASEDFAVSPERKAVGHCGVLAEELAQLEHVHGNFAERGVIAHRHHEIEDACGDALNVEVAIEVFWRDAKGLGQRG